MSTNPTHELARLSVNDFLAALAAKTSTPGGGSVAALTGSLASAQLRMTLSYTLGKKKFAEVETELQATAQQVDGLTAEFVSLMEQDRAAYETLCRFLKMAPEQQAAEKDFVPAALAAVEVPMRCAKAALRLIIVAGAIVEKINPLLISDLGVAVELARGVTACCELNVHINLPVLPDKKTAADLAQEIYAIRRQAMELSEQINRQLRTIMPQVS